MLYSFPIALNYVLQACNRRLKPKEVYVDSSIRIVTQQRCSIDYIDIEASVLVLLFCYNTCI